MKISGQTFPHHWLAAYYKINFVTIYAKNEIKAALFNQFNGILAQPTSLSLYLLGC